MSSLQPNEAQVCRMSLAAMLARELTSGAYTPEVGAAVIRGVALLDQLCEEAPTVSAELAPVLHTALTATVSQGLQAPPQVLPTLLVAAAQSLAVCQRVMSGQAAPTDNAAAESAEALSESKGGEDDCSSG